MSTFGYYPSAAPVQALQQLAEFAAQPSIPVFATLSALPNPNDFEPGALAAVLQLSALGQPTIVVNTGSQWTIPTGAPLPTISWVADLATPEVITVNAGVDEVVGAGWSLIPTQTIVRPLGIIAGAPDPAGFTLGAGGGGIYRLAVQVNYDSPAPTAGFQIQHHLQVDSGSGFADIPGGELARLDQAALQPVAGITQVGLSLNQLLLPGNSVRVVVRHDSGQSRNFTYHDYQLAANLFLALLV